MHLAINLDPARRELYNVLAFFDVPRIELAIGDGAPLDFELADFDLPPRVFIVPAKLVLRDVSRGVISLVIVVPEHNSGRTKRDSARLRLGSTVP